MNCNQIFRFKILFFFFHYHVLYVSDLYILYYFICILYDIIWIDSKFEFEENTTIHESES